MIEPLILASLIILTISAAVSAKSRRIAFALSIIAIALSLPIGINGYTLLIFFIALLNVFSLLAIKANQIAGVDYAMVAIMAIATVYIFFVRDVAMLLTLFVVVSVPTYLLVMISDEAMNVDVGIKYITFMVFATVLFIIGIVVMIHAIEAVPYPSNFALYTVGFIIMLIGLGMEVGIAPVHEWVPDVFATADPIPVSIIASIAKFAPFIIAYKVLIATFNPELANLLLILAIISAVSMFVGNIGALTAKELSRVLAYSTVANMGYVLAAFAAILNPKFVAFAIAGGLLQLTVNSFGKIGLFSSIKSDGTASWISYLLGLSFIGLPPLMGFWSKLFIIYSLVYSGYIWLAVILVINSAISVPYYLRLARELGKGWKISVANAISLFASIAMLITIVPPDWFVITAKLMEVIR